MKKYISILITLAALCACAGAYAEPNVTAAELFAANGIGEALLSGEYTREYIEYFDGNGEVRDYSDITIARGGTGYTMMLKYPLNYGADTGTIIMYGDSFVRIEDGEPEYNLYATEEYLDATHYIDANVNTYLAYPASDENMELTTDADGNYVVTVKLDAENCDQDVVNSHGNDADAAGGLVFDKFVFDADTRRIMSESLYYVENDADHICQKITFTFDADGAEYEKALTQLYSAQTREISVLLDIGEKDMPERKFTVGTAGSIKFVLPEGKKLYADGQLTQAVSAQGDVANYTSDVYYAE